VSIQKAVVERYAQGFRAGDVAVIASCLSDDVVWALHGDKVLIGKDAFAAEADPGGAPSPEIVLDRLIEEGDTVVAVGRGSVGTGRCEPVEFVYSEVFTFVGGLVSRLDTFHVWLGELTAG
jgi:ketosteroid isomerase-like protein